ncbi:MAG: GspL/Epsl periplasmic domain-containing protein, partial [Alcanivoracaceae bacterium]
LFPGDRATAKLERQFQRRLQMAGGGATDGGFLALMEPVGEAISSVRDKGVSPRSIQYSERDGNLVLELSAPDYEMLQTLQSDIENRGLAAEIANYRNQGKQVTALLKVQGS